MPIFDITFRVIYPDLTGEFLSEWISCLKQIKSFEEDTKTRIMKINLFIHSKDIEDFLDKRKRILDDMIIFFGKDCPSTGILPSSPEKPYQVAAELNLINPARTKIHYRKCKSWRYTVAEKDNCKKVWGNGIGETAPGIDTGNAAGNAFEVIRQILEAENMTFDHIIRQWNYIGNILGVKNTAHSNIQRYQVFNEVRHQYYSRFRLIPGFPAATGIGINYDGVLIDFIALAPCKTIGIGSISNPVQLNPSDYEQNVLTGDTPVGQTLKHPPMFDRAKLLFSGQKAVLFVSGTASITGQHTTGLNDIQEQLKVTIENIRILTSPENIRNNCISYESPHGLKYKRIRVYVKNDHDIDYVKSVCKEEFGNIPAVYLHADICRDALLVEIEAQLGT